MFAIQQLFDFGVEQSLCPGEMAVHDQSAARMERLCDMVREPEIPIAHISRHIAMQIAGVIKLMMDDSPVRHRLFPQRMLNSQIKGYRELQRTLVESESSSKRDILDLDGAKFKFIFSETVGLFRQALTDSGVDGGLAKNVMLQFSDLIKTNDEKLRQDLNRIGG